MFHLKTHLILCLLLRSSLSTSEECLSSGAHPTAAADYCAGAVRSDIFGETGNLFMLQFSSHHKTSRADDLDKEAAKNKGWQCHLYASGQTDAWCRITTLEGGYEYAYNGGAFDQCGGCHCCRRKVNQAQQAKLLKIARNMPLTAELQTTFNTEPPAWSCHKYTHGQTDAWCRTATIEDGISYSYAPNRPKQCGGCYCCKRKIPRSGFVRVLAEAKSPAAATAQLDDNSHNNNEAAWHCYKYTPGKDDWWCSTATIEDGYEYSYTTGKFAQCRCSCCRRKVPKIQQAQLLIAGKDLPHTMTNPWEASPAWKCHEYTSGQSDKWCSKATVVDGFEFSYTGGRFRQCGDCFCCKREIPKNQLARFFTVQKPSKDASARLLLSDIPKFVISTARYGQRTLPLVQEMRKYGNAFQNTCRVQAVIGSQCRDFRYGDLDLGGASVSTSHMKIWQHMVDKKIPVAMGIEDDVFGLTPPNFVPLLQKALDGYKNYDLFRISQTPVPTRESLQQKVNGRILRHQEGKHPVCRDFFGAGLWLMTLEGAKFALANYKFGTRRAHVDVYGYPKYGLDMPPAYSNYKSFRVECFDTGIMRFADDASGDYSKGMKEEKNSHVTSEKVHPDSIGNVSLSSKRKKMIEETLPECPTEGILMEPCANYMLGHWYTSAGRSMLADRHS